MTHLKTKKAQLNYIKKKLEKAKPDEIKQIYLYVEKVCGYKEKKWK